MASKFKCPKCGMIYDVPGNCTMCHVPLVEVKDEAVE
jgi:hypothetical protein